MSNINDNAYAHAHTDDHEQQIGVTTETTVASPAVASRSSSRIINVAPVHADAHDATIDTAAASTAVATVPADSVTIGVVDPDPITVISDLSLVPLPGSLSRQTTVTDEERAAVNGYLQLLTKLSDAWKDRPDVYIQFENLSYTVKIPIVEPGVKNFLYGFVDMVTGIGKALAKPFIAPQTKDFNVLTNLNGRIAPGTSTLVLGNAGSGKSSLLKALAGRVTTKDGLKGKILYNGQTREQLRDQASVHVSRLTTYVAQTDEHFPGLTVKETMDFTQQASLPDASLLGNNELTEMEKKRASLLISMLGLDECQNTILGNAMMRGVSGGQKRRVTLGEMLITNARVLLLDEVSTGLDAAVTYHIFNALRQWTRITRGSVVTALLQPTPETYSLFDDVILLRDGHIIYHGPRTQIRTWLRSYAGINIPAGADEAGVLLDFITDPHTLIHSLAATQKLKAHAHIGEATTKQLDTSSNLPLARHLSPPGQNDGSGRVVIHMPASEESTSKHQPSPSPASYETTTGAGFPTVGSSSSLVSMVNAMVPNSAPTTIKPEGWDSPLASTVATSTTEMLDAYEHSPYSKAMAMELAHSYTKCNDLTSNPQLRLHASTWSEYTRRNYGQAYAHSWWYLMRAVLARDIIIAKRNLPYVVIPHMFQALFFGIIYGTLFFQLSVSDFGSKFGLIGFVVLYGAFGNMAELPLAAEAREVVSKQIDAGFYSASPYVLSLAAVSWPLMVAENVVFGTLMYWIPAFAEDGGRFMFFLLLCFCSSLSLSTFFRSIAYMSPSSDVAQQLCMPFILLFVVFSGFLIPYDAIPKWLVEIYWVNPFSWSFTSMSQNEFKSGVYGEPTTYEGQVMRQGDAYLKAYTVATDKAWLWPGVIMQFVWFFAFAIVASWALTTCRFTKSLGTKRLNQQVKKVVDDDEPITDGNVKNNDGAIAIEMVQRQTSNNNPAFKFTSCQRFYDQQ